MLLPPFLATWLARAQGLFWGLHHAWYVDEAAGPAWAYHLDRLVVRAGPRWVEDPQAAERMTG